MTSEEKPFYIPDVDEPSVFSSAITVREHGGAKFNQDHWTWPKWFKNKNRVAYFNKWREDNPDKPSWHCPPYMFGPDATAAGIGLIVRLREELKPSWGAYPTFDPVPTMFVGDSRLISLRWVLQYARDNQLDPDHAALIAEQERDRDGLTLNEQEQWQEKWWNAMMDLPGIAYPIWRYKSGQDIVAIPYLLMPSKLEESVVVLRVHEKNPNITYKLVTIRKKGGEVVGEFTGYEGFDREKLGELLNGFWAGF